MFVVSKKTSNDAVMPQSSVVLIVLVNDLRSPTSTMSTVKLCGITASFGIFLETNKHQNLTRLRVAVPGERQKRKVQVKC